MSFATASESGCTSTGIRKTASHAPHATPGQSDAQRLSLNSQMDLTCRHCSHLWQSRGRIARPGRKGLCDVQQRPRRCSSRLAPTLDQQPQRPLSRPSSYRSTSHREAPSAPLHPFRVLRPRSPVRRRALGPVAVRSPPQRRPADFHEPGPRHVLRGAACRRSSDRIALSRGQGTEHCGSGVRSGKGRRRKGVHAPWRQPSPVPVCPFQWFRCADGIADRQGVASLVVIARDAIATRT